VSEHSNLTFQPSNNLAIDPALLLTAPNAQADGVVTRVDNEDVVAEGNVVTISLCITWIPNLVLRRTCSYLYG
jgi:hypothetical protein